MIAVIALIGVMAMLVCGCALALSDTKRPLIFKDRRVRHMPTPEYRRYADLCSGKDAWSGHCDTDKYYSRMEGEDIC